MEAEVTLEQALGIHPPTFVGNKREVRLLTGFEEPDPLIAKNNLARLRSWSESHKRKYADLVQRAKILERNAKNRRKRREHKSGNHDQG